MTDTTLPGKLDLGYGIFHVASFEYPQNMVRGIQFRQGARQLGYDKKCFAVI